ncbi:unnamed protein product [marine sediment metagenome]|uniref:Uncharacterized protein n=2 Tax=marine sediment metagenome TaxID=412755 RepID=X1BUP7_9ZZZZ
MTQINNTEIKKIYQEAVKKDEDFMKKLLKYILQIVLEEERDEDWRTVRRYMRMLKEDENLYVDEYLIQEINNLKKEETLEEVLVTH